MSFDERIHPAHVILLVTVKEMIRAFHSFVLYFILAVLLQCSYDVVRLYDRYFIVDRPVRDVRRW